MKEPVIKSKYPCIVCTEDHQINRSKEGDTLMVYYHLTNAGSRKWGTDRIHISVDSKDRIAIFVVMFGSRIYPTSNGNSFYQFVKEFKKMSGIDILKYSNKKMRKCIMHD